MEYWKKKQMDEGKAMAEAIADFVNGSSDLSRQGFVEQMTWEHNTLQESAMRLFYKTIVAWSKSPKVDLRNQAAHDLCKKIVAEFGEDPPLPYI